MSYKLTKGDGLNMLRKLGESGERVNLVFTSPPYNIGSKAPRKDGKRKHGQYDPKSYGGITGYSDSLPEEEYQDTQVRMLELAARTLAPTGILVYNHKPRRKDLRMIHPMEWLLRVPSLTLMEEVIWDRGSTHNHCNRMFWPTTERLYVFRLRDGKYSFRNEASLQFRSDVWRIPLTSRPALGHAAPYPEPLAREVVKAFTNLGDLVCDPYSGSGTTAVAAVTQGRRFVGAEKDTTYYQMSKKRIQEAQRLARVV